MGQEFSKEQEAPVGPTAAQLKMDIYVHYRKVKACKIGGFSDGLLIPEDKNIEPFPISAGYMNTCDPVQGGYYVRYYQGREKGREIFMTAEAFEDEFKLKDTRSVTEQLQELKKQR